MEPAKRARVPETWAGMRAGRSVPGAPGLDSYETLLGMFAEG